MERGCLEISNDTSYIKNFPLNPISSGVPFPYERQYIMLGECLLWTVEGIRNGSGYGSLNPVLVDTITGRGLNGSEILTVRDHYQDWWSNYEQNGWKEKDPLEGTPKWR